MKVNKIIELDIVTDGTEVFIRDADFHMLAKGNWYCDNVLAYLNFEAGSFTWKDDNKLYIDLKEEDA